MNEAEIRARVTSESIPVLRQALRFVNEKLSEERSREVTGERRATAVLAVVGILAGFIVNLISFVLRIIGLLDKTSWSELWAAILLYALYVGSIGFLLKGGFYGIQALKSLSGNRLTPELALDTQTMQEGEALQEELIWKIWEYYQLLPLANQRLFFTDRAQRNVIASVCSLALLGFLSMILKEMSLPELSYVAVPVACAAIAVGVLTVGALFCLDRIAEKEENVWSN